MDKIPCRGCRTLLSYEVTACPICLRGRTKYEITRDYAQLRENQARRRRRPFVILGVAAAVGAAAGAAYKYRGPLSAAYASLSTRATKMADDAQDPQRLLDRAPSLTPTSAPPEPVAPPSVAPTPAPKPPPPPAAAAASAPKDDGVEHASASPLNAPWSGGPSSEKSPLALPTMNAQSQWAIRGRAFDLLTLKPVAGLRFSVALLAADGPDYPTGGFTTDDHGRFVVVLGRQTTGNYGFVAEDPGFLPSVFYESDIPYRTLPAADRREMAANARAGDINQSGITDIVGESLVERDLFVVPRR